MASAQACGLLVAPTFAYFEDQSAVVSIRFDRSADPGSQWLRRVHQEDLCQALGKPPEEKYRNDGGPGIRDVCTRLRDVLPPEPAEAAVWRFFDACTFSWLIGGTDAHAKNYSLLLAGPQVRLAPLYDVASALPYPGMDVQRLRGRGGRSVAFAGSSSGWPTITSSIISWLRSKSTPARRTVIR